MNRELWLREVRRQGVPALALVGLSLLLELATGVFLRHKGPGGLVPMLISLLGPYLLGVAAVAPDVESGAETFLSRLPLARGRLFLMRALVAAGWSLALVLSVLVIDQGLSAVSSSEARFLIHGGCALTAGLLASCAIRPTLAAFLLGPLLVGVPVWLFQTLLERGLRMAVSDQELLVLAAGAGALLAGWVTYQRGDLHLPGWRSLRVASAALGALLALASGATTAAWGLSDPSLDRQVGRVVSTPAGLVAAVTGWPSGAGWWHPTSPDWRVDLVRVDEGGRARARRLPEGLQPLALSPDGERCLAAVWGTGGHELSLWDTGTGQLLGRGERLELRLGWSSRLLSAGPGVVEWVDGVPWLAAPERLVGVGPGARVELPTGMTWRGLADGRALFGRGDELRLVDLRRPGTAPAAVDLGAGLLDACLAGPFVVAAAAEEDGVHLRWLARDGGRGSVLLPGLRLPASVAGLTTEVRVRACGPDLIVSWSQPEAPLEGRRAERVTSGLYRLEPPGGGLTELCAVAPHDWQVLGPGWLALHEKHRHRVVRLGERQDLIVDGRPGFAEEHVLPPDLWPVSLSGRGRRQQAFLLQDGRVVEPQSGGVTVQDPLAAWRGASSDP